MEDVMLPVSGSGRFVVRGNSLVAASTDARGSLSGVRWVDGGEGLGALHVTAVATNCVACLAIAVLLWLLARQRRDPQTGAALPWVASALLACGVARLFQTLGGSALREFDVTVELSAAVVLALAVVTLLRAVRRPAESSRPVAADAGMQEQMAGRSRAEAELRRVSEELRELTARHEQASRDSGAFAMLALDSSPTAQLMIDVGGRIVLFNRMAERIFGYARGELVGQPVESLIPRRLREAHAAQRSEFMRSPAMRAMGAGRDLFAVRKDGSEFPVEIGLQPLSTPGGQMVLASVIDITARKEVEDQRRKDAEALAASNRELEQFAQFASHDLQEPLRKLVSFSELLVEDLGVDLPEAAKRDLGYITDAALRMRSLVRALLDLSRSGRREMTVQDVALADCVREAIDALSVSIEEARADVSADPLPSWRGDRVLLTQLFQNLIGNAIKFRRPGDRPVVRVTCERREGRTVFGVRDNGIGIATENLDEVFRPFRRLHGRGEYEGTGIGLAICVKAVERHGGRIWATSEPGQGTHFQFTLEPESSRRSGASDREVTAVGG